MVTNIVNSSYMICVHVLAIYVAIDLNQISCESVTMKPSNLAISFSNN